MIDVSVIIVSYNTKELTSNAVASVLSKTYGVQYELIIVDNASKDGSPDYLKSKFKDKIFVIENDSNLGFGRANNIGIRRSSAKYIFLLNSDTELLNNAVKIFFDYMENNQNVGICGGNLFNRSMEPLLSFGMQKKSLFSHFIWKYNAFFLKIQKLFTKKKMNYLFNYENKPKEVGYITGTDMFIRRDVFDKSGLFDENIFMYCEDVDLSYRIYNLGYKIISLPQVKILHLESKSVGDILNKYRLVLSGQYYFYFKLYGKKAIYIHLSSVCSYLFRIAVYYIIPVKLLKKIFFNPYSSEDYKKILKEDRKQYKEAELKYKRKSL